MDAEEEMVITLASRRVARNIRHQLPLLKFENQVERPYAISLPVLQMQGVRAETYVEINENYDERECEP